MADAEGCDRTNDEGVPVTASPLATGIRDGIKLAFSGTILDWAEENVKFPASDRASRFDRSVAPWMNEPLLAASDDETTQVFVRAATGAGKTTYMEGIACFIVAQKPGPTLCSSAKPMTW
jgi:phage terminase large subunit GpA-like protein